MPQWIFQPHNLPAADLCVAYTTSRAPRPLLHLNFNTHDGLVAALAAVPFLVRCSASSAAAPGWGGPKHCGLPRHQLPELLEMTCVPSGKHNPAGLLDEVKRLLSQEMQLEYTALWFANSQHRQQSGAGQSVRVVIKVLPRLAGAAQLRQDVERLHQRFKLWGGTLRVSAPNDPQLCRCSQCDQLGHQASQCPLFAGVAVRLLLKQPASFAWLQSVSRRAEARLAYLGGGPERRRSSRVAVSRCCSTCLSKSTVRKSWRRCSL